MGLQHRSARWARRLQLCFIGIFGLLAVSCGDKAASSASVLPDQYWVAHSYSLPKSKSRYVQWGTRSEYAIGYTPAFYFVPSYFAQAYPPWLYQPNENVDYGTGPSWYPGGSSYYGAPNYGVPPWAVSNGWGGEIVNGPAFGMPWANNPIWSPQNYGEPAYGTGQSGVVTAVTGFNFSPGDGTHSPSLTACSSGTSIAQIADCGGGECSGLENACEATASFNDAPGSNTPPVFADFLITATGMGIVGGPGCPANYSLVAEIADCGTQASCYGNQEFCAAIVPANSTGIFTSYVAGIKLVGLGSHSPTAPACPSGYEQKGSFADCTGVTGNACPGFVSVCTDIQ